MSDIVNKLWGFCHTLKHDGIGYAFYVEQLTYMLFIKMAEERGVELPKKCDWNTLSNLSGTDLVDGYTALVRGVPELLIIYLLFFSSVEFVTKVATAFGYAGLADAGYAFIIAVIAIGAISGAYSTEVVRGALASIPQGHIEAARALGLPGLRIFRRIIAPQMLRIAVPGMNNVWQTTIKDTALVSVVGLQELMRTAFIGALDGHFARALGVASDFGVQMDSLADMTSFVTAGSILSFYWLEDQGPAWLLGAVSVLYVVMGGLRLARDPLRRPGVLRDRGRDGARRGARDHDARAPAQPDRLGARGVLPAAHGHDDRRPARDGVPPVHGRRDVVHPGPLPAAARGDRRPGGGARAAAVHAPHALLHDRRLACGDVHADAVLARAELGAVLCVGP